MDKVLQEWESTIAIPTDETSFLEAQTQECKIDIIFSFENGRISNRVAQTKVTTYCRDLLGYYKNQWFPIKRTQSTETLIKLPKRVKIEKTTHRLIFFLSNGIRKSINKEECKFGERYTIEYEIEYKENSAYEDILKIEEVLMAQVYDDGHQINRQCLTLKDMFSCVMSKVEMWHCFDDSKPYIWAYKYNGKKAKMLITDKVVDGKHQTYFWPDGENVSIKYCIGDNLHMLYNLCLLVEIMENKIVLIEIIGSSFANNIFTTEPYTTAMVLKYLKTQMTNAFLNDQPIIVQQFFKSSLPDSLPSSEFDGFVIIQKGIIIKWKHPMIDVKCTGTFTFKAGNTIFKNVIKIWKNEELLLFEGIPSKIYEVSSDFVVLRERTERFAASSEKEYQNFLQSKTWLEESSNT